MYFLTGNLWLIVGLFLMLGRTPVPFGNGTFSFFGNSVWFAPGAYNGFIAFALGAAGVSFVLAFCNRNKADASR